MRQKIIIPSNGPPNMFGGPLLGVYFDKWSSPQIAAKLADPIPHEMNNVSHRGRFRFMASWRIGYLRQWRKAIANTAMQISRGGSEKSNMSWIIMSFGLSSSQFQ